MKLKAAVFDLDGTLLNTLEDLYLTMVSVLEKGGYPPISHKTVKHLIGSGAREFMRLSLPPYARDNDTIDKNLTVYHKEYDDYGCKTTRPYDGITDVLQKLNQNDIPVAILSNKPHAATVNVIGKYFGDIKFKAVTGQQENFLPKPDTASAVYTAKLMGIEPYETAFIGDGEADAMAANAGGFYQVSVLWGYRTKKELAAAGAKNFVSEPGEILKLFGI